MSDINPPSLPTTSTNIASLANKDTLSNIKQSGTIKTFGDQAKDKAKQQVIKAATDSPLTRLYKEKADLVKEGIQLDITHQKTLYDLDQQNKKYKKLQEKGNQEATNITPEPTPPQLIAQDTVEEGTPPYKYEISEYPDNQSKIRVYDSEYKTILTYIINSSPTDNSTKQNVEDIIKQLNQTGAQTPVLRNRRYLIHLFGVPEDQKPKSPTSESSTTPPQPTSGLSDEEYQKAVDNENKNYDEAQKNLQDRKDKNQKSIDDILKDPFKKQKDEYKKLKDKLKKRKKQTKEERKKALKSRAKSVLQNNKASIVAILTLTLTNGLANIIAQNTTIGKLVNDTNNIITEANESGDQAKLNNAKIARDNAIRIIQNNEDKIKNLQEQIQNITIFANIFLIIVSILSAIPIPVSFPPGVGIPMNVITLVSKLLEYANKLALALLALAPMLLAVLDKAISILEDYKSQLLDINGQLENAATSGNNNLLYGNNGNGGIKTGLTGEIYKGFKFALKEEDNLKFNVRGFKRHYAVAIDINNVEILKSDYSFTLDPNDLISQLKLLIDRQNLSTGNGLSSNNNPQNLISDISEAEQISASIQTVTYPPTATTVNKKRSKFPNTIKNQ